MGGLARSRTVENKRDSWEGKGKNNREEKTNGRDWERQVAGVDGEID